MKMAIDGVGVSSICSRGSPMWHHFQPPSLQVASTLMGALTNRVVLVSRQPGFCF